MNPCKHKMSVNPEGTAGSGIVSETLDIMPCCAREASHFVLRYGKQIKYIISLKGGLACLKKTISAYNPKLALLLRMMPCIPWRALRLCGFGAFAQVHVNPIVQSYLPDGYAWNVLVGTYNSVQKIVFQCYRSAREACLYVKVGNHCSQKLMENETNYLRNHCELTNFKLPELINYLFISENNKFNILVTKEIPGGKIAPVLTSELYKISRQIAGDPIWKDGVCYEFSHGDFAPWNIRKYGEQYYVFDWEHCGMRPMGYDAAHFIIMCEMMLKKADFDAAFSIAEKRLSELEPNIHLDKNLIYNEYIKIAHPSVS